MKKNICLFLCVLLLLGCAACTKKPATPMFSASKDAMEKQTVNYYFMTSNGAIIDPKGAYKTKWGDSCLVVFPNGQTMLIDAGMQQFYPILKNRLAELGVTKLDYVVFTHPHNDHCGGMWAGLMKDFPIGQVYHNGQKNPSWDKSGSGNHVEDYCKKYEIPCEALGAGDEKTFGDVSMKVLWPTQEAITAYNAAGGKEALNCLSLVMRFDFGQHSGLFTGDLYKTYNGLEDENGEQIPGMLGAEQQLVTLYPNGELDVDFLKLPHHGDPSTSNSPELFAATTPKMVMATSFNPVGDYLNVFKKRGYKNATFFDRQYGNVQFFATADGNLKVNLERTDYLENFGKTWNKELERG